MLEHILRSQAQILRNQFDDHDTADFMHRLAVRIAQEAARPPRVQTAPTGDDDVPPPAAATGAWLPASPAAPPPGRGTYHLSPARPRIRRSLRRRPTPIIATDPATTPTAVIDHVRKLCEAVLRSDDIDTLRDFADDYDQAGARTFACLLYTMDRRESALYWWRFAAGAGDALAAHLLAAHHAAVGRSPDARLWRAFARMLGFTTGRHMPHPVRARTDLADRFASTVPGNTQQRQFLTSDRLPGELITH
ncbi:hypothetical protein ACWF94_17580 [Streptomyces sp. NPDC055078]